ncbi:MAG TPA: pitrilysin family protein, partial [Candidatus Sumerlaeia bacterium]|nr:pitrilysin family protein [Candidatus Sumerlaeia bacterium]
MKKHTLKNGMTVLILENPDSKVVTLDVWINTGSAFEPKDINGVSHFLEHMLFKGTEKRAVGEIDREIEAVGGLWNAGTSLEFTHYYLTVAAPYFQIGADALADVIANSKLESAEVERERQVILEEYHRQQDDPDNYLMTMVYWNSFESSPSRWPVLGTPDTINAITPERLRQYYHERYTPANMALV